MAYSFRDLHWSKDISVRQYLLPQTLSEALDMLAEYDGRARVVAGGTDVIPLLRKGKLKVDALVDISRIPNMNYIEKEGEYIRLGGLVSHAQAAASPVIQKYANLLACGASWVGSPQIRNIATISGNLVNGQPAADTSIPLLALDASVTVASREGERNVPLSRFFLGIGKTDVDPAREILVQISFKAMGPNQGGCYLRLGKRRALVLPMLVAGVVITIDPEQRLFTDAALAFGPVAPTPYRAKNAEDLLRGHPITEEVLAKAGDAAFQECTPRDSCLRGSCDYRCEMARVFVRRGVKKALQEAGFRGL